MKTDILVRLAYNDIFTQRMNIDSLLKKLDINDSLFVLSSINEYDYKLREKDNSELSFILNEWLIEENRELRKSIIDAYAKHSEKTYESKQLRPNLRTVVLINRISTLRALEVLCSQKKNQKSQPKVNKSKSRENLLMLYLLISDEVANRQNRVFRKYFIKKPEYIDEVHLHLFLGIAQPFPHYSKTNSLQAEIYKFLLFEKWFRNHVFYSEFLNTYVKQIGLNNWLEYFNDVFQLCQVAIKSNIVSIENYPILKILAEHLEIDKSNNPEWSEFVFLRKNPLVKLDNKRYAVLDFEFLLNKFFSSLYHDLVFFSKQQGLDRFSQDYVKEFVEGSLIENAIQTSHGSSFIQYSEKDMKNKADKNVDNLGLPDYYLRNGSNVMIIECKNSYISNANKTELNTDKLLRELKEKFYYTKNDNSKKRKQKAILQLLNFMNNSIEGKYQFFDKNKKPENLTYYPILLVMDHTLTSFGFNQLLNSYFQKELEDSTIKKKYKIKPLTIIHIDDFFIHQNRLRKLPQLIISYHRFLRDKESFDSMISFSDYLRVIKFANSSKSNRESVQHIIEDSLLPEE